MPIAICQNEYSVLFPNFFLIQFTITKLNFWFCQIIVFVIVIILTWIGRNYRNDRTIRFIKRRTLTPKRKIRKSFNNLFSLNKTNCEFQKELTLNEKQTYPNTEFLRNKQKHIVVSCISIRCICFLFNKGIIFVWFIS